MVWTIHEMEIHFTKEETEVQWNQVVCLRTQSQSVTQPEKEIKPNTISIVHVALIGLNWIKPSKYANVYLLLASLKMSVEMLEVVFGTCMLYH